MIPAVSAAATAVRPGAAVTGRLRRLGRATFGELTADCAGVYEVVARFLALLDLYREGNVTFEQHVPLGELHVTWTAGHDGPDAAAAEEDDP